MAKEYTSDELSAMDGIERAKVAIEAFQSMVPIIDILGMQIQIQQEDQIMKAVADVGVRVDKKRLMMALSDAQRFYEEGYEAAMYATDVAKVVRCKDCKHYMKSMMLCNHEDGLNTPDKLDYCSYGERWDEA